MSIEDSLKTKIDTIYKELSEILNYLYLLLPVVILLLFLIGSEIEYQVNIPNIYPYQSGIIFICVGIYPYVIYIYKTKRLKSKIGIMITAETIEDNSLNVFIGYYNSFIKFNKWILLFYAIGLITYFIYMLNQIN